MMSLKNWMQHICKDDEEEEEEAKIIRKAQWFADDVRKLKPPKKTQQKDLLNGSMLHFLSTIFRWNWWINATH
jgi:hypothetical protein